MEQYWHSLRVDRRDERVWLGGQKCGHRAALRGPPHTGEADVRPVGYAEPVQWQLNVCAARRLVLAETGERHHAASLRVHQGGARERRGIIADVGHALVEHQWLARRFVDALARHLVREAPRPRAEHPISVFQPHDTAVIIAEMKAVAAYVSIIVSATLVTRAIPASRILASTFEWEIRPRRRFASINRPLE